MEEADKFAADILGVNPDNLTDDNSDELLTNNEEENSKDIDSNQEEAQPSEEEQSEAQQEETDKTQPSEIQEPRRTNRIQKRIQQLLAKQNEVVQSANDEYEDTLTHDQLQEMIRREAQTLLEQKEIEKLQEEHKEIWAEDLEYLIQENPELDPDSPQYNKQLDDFLTNLITDENGEPNVNVPIVDIYYQLTAIMGEKRKVQAEKNKKVLAKQFDEASLGDGSQAQYQRSRKTISDLDPNDPVAFIKAIESGEVDY